MKLPFFILCALLCGTVWAKGKETEVSSLPLRKDLRYGIYLSSFGDTTFGLVSLNGAYNFTENLRLTIGVGSALNLGFSGGAAIKYLFLGDSPITPVIGLGGSVGHFSNPFSNLFSGAPPSFETWLMGSVSVGFDWQTRAGFNLGFGATGMVSKQPLILPYLSLGWFFR